MSFYLFPLLFTSFLINSINCQCHQPDDNYINNICYTISNQPLNYKSAQSYCHGLSSNLAIMSSTLQANFLASAVRTKTGSNEALFWIGLSRSSVSSRFTWDDGTPMTWSNFDNNFPKDDLYVAESVVNGKWRTTNGDQSFYFVCSYDPRIVTPGTVQPSTIGYETSSIGYDTSSTVQLTSTYSYSTSSPSFSTSTTGYPESTVPVSTSSSPPESTSQSTSDSTSSGSTTTAYYTDSSTSSSFGSTAPYDSTTADQSTTTSSDQGILI
ncbi:unnamed protein product [Caenorhabditis brenneri]